MLRIHLIAAILFAAVLVLGVPARAASAIETPVVVELFTSQGCSSCPPADRLLGELARRPDVIALSLHVDYWDYIGWKDPFASRQMTERQRAYVRSLDGPYVYTPQMVIDGQIDVVGSRRDEVMARIAEAKRRPMPLVPRFEHRDGESVLVVPAGEARAPASVWLALYDRRHATEVARGENAGRELVHHHVVREFRKVATWTGERLEIPLDADAAAADGRDGCAVLVQMGETGPILGAARMTLSDGGGS